MTFDCLRETEPPAPVKSVVNPFAIERPHAAPHLLERQGSFRGLSQLNQSSPFKRQMSLRIGDLPSTVERQQNSLSNEAPSYKSTLAITPGKAVVDSITLESYHLLRPTCPLLLHFVVYEIRRLVFRPWTPFFLSRTFFVAWSFFCFHWFREPSTSSAS